MPKSQGVPSYRFHKARNCAVVTLDGRNHYLGPYDSPESKATYAEKIAEWQRNRISVPGAPAIATAGYTVGRLAADYRRFAEGYYRKNGESTTQVVRVQEALKPLVALYEELPAIEFGPLKLRNVQQHLVSRGLCRTYINSLMGCLKLAFKWAAAEEKIPASVPEALRYVTGLKRGRTTAPEPKPIEAVDEATVNETIKFLSPTVAAMVRLQLLSGARPGEMCSLRPCDVTLNIDGTACFRPESHKTEHHGRERRVYLGPLALAILKPFLERDTGANCFSPAESVAWHRDQHRAARKTPLWPSHQRRNATKRKPDPGRVAGDSFTAASYSRAIARACEVAFGMPAELRTINRKLPESEQQELKRQAREWRRRNCWAANQLRHAAATRLRKEFGLESAQVCLGHSDPKVTLRYAEQDFEAAKRIMAEVG